MDDEMSAQPVPSSVASSSVSWISHRPLPREISDRADGAAPFGAVHVTTALEIGRAHV